MSSPTAGHLPTCHPESVSIAALGGLGRGWWPWQWDREVPGRPEARLVAMAMGQRGPWD